MLEIFSKSERFKQEYCASIVQIGELFPIEGSDFLCKTFVCNFPIVVRKDEVKEGDYMVYCANETQLNSGFLASNNLFEYSAREYNKNASEVCKIASDVALLRNTVKTKEMQVKQAVDNPNAEIGSDEIEKLKNEISDITKQAEDLEYSAKRMVGFFQKNGRVKIIKLRGCPSEGFLFAGEDLGKWLSKLNGINLADYVGTEFDTVCGKLFCKAYVPPTKENVKKGRHAKRDKKLASFNRMVQGQFNFHYDTAQLQRNMDKIHPDDVLDISLKVHGTSDIMCNILTRIPVVLNSAQLYLKRSGNKRIRGIRKSINRNIAKRQKQLKTLNEIRESLPKNYRIGYGDVYASRTVIKNKTINQTVTNGYYDSDIWGEYNEILKKYIPKGMSVYGEIFGYLTSSARMIQPDYDYGCMQGQNKLMPYRISTDNGDGTNREWEVSEVYAWTVEMMNKHPELADRLMPIQILYHGTLRQLYPDLDTNNHWHENVLERLSSDLEHFGMEKNETLCKYHKVPREGIVIRKCGDKVPEAFKLKCKTFLFKESQDISNGRVDIEMEQAYGEN